MREQKIIASLFAALCVAGCASSPTSKQAVDKSSVVSKRDTHERLNGVLWVQTSAEFKLLAATTFREAGSALRRIDADRQRGLTIPSAAEEQTEPFTPLKPLAIVVDIDETLLDNSPMSGRLVKERAPYTSENWSGWVEKSSATFLPGATDFIKTARSMGYAVFFVTNRTKAEEGATLKNLAALGATEQEILANEEIGPGQVTPWESEKQARREFIARTHWIVLMVGDDLADFIAGIRKMPAQARVDEAQKRASRFGSQWFLLPNPLYGSWESVLYDRTSPDAKQLQDKRDQVLAY